jgi:hypothetical protein
LRRLTWSLSDRRIAIGSDQGNRPLVFLHSSGVADAFRYKGNQHGGGLKDGQTFV